MIKFTKRAIGAMEFTGDQRAFCSITYEQTKSTTATKRKFTTKFKKKSPTKDTIKKWHSTFMNTGNSTTPRKAPAPTVTTPQAATAIDKHFEDYPNESIRRASLALDIKQTSIQRMLKTNKWKPYKMHIVQKLSDNDAMLRKSFAEMELSRIQTNPNHLSSLTFSDEAHFHLDGRVNRHNSRCWSRVNPGWIGEEGLHSPRTTVWAAICESGIYGPFFFDENVSSESYLQMLKESFWPSVEEKGLTNTILFMQDGAPPHFGLSVRSWLDEKLPNRWMGRGSSNMPWPPRSPDLTPCDFFLWGFIKSKVYGEKCKTIQELKTRIETAFQDHITEEMCRQVMMGYQRRLQKCFEIDGGQVETDN